MRVRLVAATLLRSWGRLGSAGLLLDRWRLHGSRRPGRLGVRLSRRDGRLALEVSDDGAGFDPGDPELRSRRLGLTSMEERAQRLGGTLEIRSAPGAGTTVQLEAPVG